MKFMQNYLSLFQKLVREVRRRKRAMRYEQGAPRGRSHL